jgi:hypothetical protein
VVCQHSATPVVLAWHDKFAGTSGRRSFVHFSADAVSILVQFRNYRVVFGDDFHDFCDFQVALGFVSIAKGALVIFLCFSNFAVGKDIFAMVFVVVVHENRVQGRFGEFQAPLVAAFHTVGVGGDAGQVGADTLFATAE